MKTKKELEKSIQDYENILGIIAVPIYIGCFSVLLGIIIAIWGFQGLGTKIAFTGLVLFASFFTFFGLVYQVQKKRIKELEEL